MNISKQKKEKVLIGIFIGLCIVFVSLLPQLLYAEEQVIENTEYCQNIENSDLSEKQLSEVQGQGFELAVNLRDGDISRIILWDEKANVHTDISIATGTMNYQSNVLSVQGR